MIFKVDEHAHAQTPKLTSLQDFMSNMRNKLIRNVGIARAEQVLYEFSFELGQQEAKCALEKTEDLDELVKIGPELHINYGLLQEVKHECQFQLNQNQKVVYLVGQGEWMHSYEAHEHLRHFGVSNKPVCFSLAGFASGFMSTIFHEKVVAKELTCVAKGDAQCTWILKPQHQWEIESQDTDYLMSTSAIEHELSYTYDQLFEQKKGIQKLSDYQKLVSDQLLHGSTFKDIFHMSHEFLEIPICFQDKNMIDKQYYGLHEKEFHYLEDDFSKHLAQHAFDDIFSQQKSMTTRVKKIETQKQIRLVAPVTIRNDLIGWIFFVYDKLRTQPKDIDALFLDRLMNIASLTLLNEKTRFESFERMKGNYLEQLLQQNLSEKELYKRGLFAGVDLTKPYFVVVCSYKQEAMDVHTSFQLDEHIFEASFTFFNDRKLSALTGHHDGHTVYLLSDCSNVEQAVGTVKDMLVFINTHVSTLNFSLGVSTANQGVLQVHNAYKEASIALKLSYSEKVMCYEDVDIMGLLIKDTDVDLGMKIASKELGCLAEFKVKKNMELLKTLYTFLMNGGNLDNTRRDLNLSLSGLRHRLQTIEEILQKDLRNPQVMYKLLSIIKLLLVTGDDELRRSLT